MQRAILMMEMPPSDYDDWRTWGLALKEQSQRCEWGPKYSWEVAALDALLYQCPDDHWRKKILAGKWDFQTALDYGIHELVAKKTGQALRGNGNNSKRDKESINRVGQAAKDVRTFCKLCVRRHGQDSCPAKDLACGKKGHYAKSWECPNNAKHSGQTADQTTAQRGTGKSQQRGNGRGRGSRAGRPGDNQATGNNSSTSSKTVFRRIGNTNQYVRRKRTETVKYVEEDYPEEGEEYSEEDFEFNMGGIEGINKLGSPADPTYM